MLTWDDENQLKYEKVRFSRTFHGELFSIFYFKSIEHSKCTKMYSQEILSIGLNFVSSFPRLFVRFYEKFQNSSTYLTSPSVSAIICFWVLLIVDINTPTHALIHTHIERRSAAKYEIFGIRDFKTYKFIKISIFKI